MYLASHMTAKNTQVSSTLLAATPLSIFHIHPMEISRVQVVELHLCMRYDAEGHFKPRVTARWPRKPHQSVHLGQAARRTGGIRCRDRLPGSWSFAICLRQCTETQDVVTVPVCTAQHSPEYYSHPLDITHHQSTGHRRICGCNAYSLTRVICWRTGQFSACAQ
jgi:hypothetical protein